jgi:hypothetical protein
VNLTCQVFGGKPGPFPMVPVFRMVRPVDKVQFRVKPYPEPTREIGPFAHTGAAPVNTFPIALIRFVRSEYSQFPSIHCWAMGVGIRCSRI